MGVSAAGGNAVAIACSDGGESNQSIGKEEVGDFVLPGDGGPASCEGHRCREGKNVGPTQTTGFILAPAGRLTS